MTPGQKKAVSLFIDFISDMIEKKGISERDAMMALGYVAGSSIAIDYGSNGDLGADTMLSIREGMASSMKKRQL